MQRKASLLNVSSKVNAEGGPELKMEVTATSDANSKTQHHCGGYEATMCIFRPLNEMGKHRAFTLTSLSHPSEKVGFGWRAMHIQSTHIMRFYEALVPD